MFFSFEQRARSRAFDDYVQTTNECLNNDRMDGTLAESFVSQLKKGLIQCYLPNIWHGSVSRPSKLGDNYIYPTVPVKDYETSFNMESSALRVSPYQLTRLALQNSLASTSLSEKIISSSTHEIPPKSYGSTYTRRLIAEIDGATYYASTAAAIFVPANRRNRIHSNEHYMIHELTHAIDINYWEKIIEDVPNIKRSAALELHAYAVTGCFIESEKRDLAADVCINMWSKNQFEHNTMPILSYEDELALDSLNILFH